MIEFPKSLYKGEPNEFGYYLDEVIVQSEEEEADARKQGYAMLGETPKKKAKK